MFSNIKKITLVVLIIWLIILKFTDNTNVPQETEIKEIGSISPKRILNEGLQQVENQEITINGFFVIDQIKETKEKDYEVTLNIKEALKNQDVYNFFNVRYDTNEAYEKRQRYDWLNNADKTNVKEKVKELLKSEYDIIEKKRIIEKKEIQNIIG